jgi:hypothetical protein
VREGILDFNLAGVSHPFRDVDSEQAEAVLEHSSHAVAERQAAGSGGFILGDEDWTTLVE